MTKLTLLAALGLLVMTPAVAHAEEMAAPAEHEVTATEGEEADAPAEATTTEEATPAEDATSSEEATPAEDAAPAEEAK